MKKNLLFIGTVLLHITAPGQDQQKIDSLKTELSLPQNDTSKVLLLEALCVAYYVNNFDSATLYGQQGIELAKKINFLRGEAMILPGLVIAFVNHGDVPKGLELGFKGLQIAEENNFQLEKSMNLTQIGRAYGFVGDFNKKMGYLKKAEQINEANQNNGVLAWDDVKTNTDFQIGMAYSSDNKLDSAFFYFNKTYNRTLNNANWHDILLSTLGDFYLQSGNGQKALEYYRKSIEIAEKKNDPYTALWCYIGIAEFYQEEKLHDSCIFYAKAGLETAQKVNAKQGILTACSYLSDQYEDKDIQQAFFYRKMGDSIKDELLSPKKIIELQKTVVDEQERQRKIEGERIAYQNKLKQYAFLAGLLIMLTIAVILYLNAKQKHKANRVLEKTLTELKSTQSQLIQSEKMASLGELTAGIAHEIQNPLNFVNNFSEVNKELLVEMKDEMNKGNLDDANAIANDVMDNEEKINQYGKRADAIVKGMLQHSRRSSGQKEPTDINALADEYFRLAYHGLRAKDKDFKATAKTDYDETIGKINIIPQDIGRVILNLITNAFYAVTEKKRAASEDYEPTVAVSTKELNSKVEVSVKDNGNGIPRKVLDKIFQPFFTTKPTGQGTGLGLSLSYDIVKAHGGELRVETKEGEGAEFIIQLPITF